MTQLSLVIPVFQEQGNLRPLFDEIRQTATQHGYRIEAIVVDDGSRDSTWSEIVQIAGEASAAADGAVTVHGIRFRRNFGKAAALRAGIRRSSHRIVLTMDGDMQDDPAEFPKLLAKIDAGFDVVSGWKQTRRDSWQKVLPSRLFNWLVRRMTGVAIHDLNCGLKAYRREVFDDLHLYGELHRFIPVLAASQGWRIGEVVVNHRRRLHGRSKYGVRRLVKGMLDLLTVWFLTDYQQRPQHLMGTVGLVSLGLGALGLVYLAVYWVLRMQWFPEWEPLHQRPLLLYSLGAVLLGTQLVSIGLLAELLAAQRFQTRHPYSVRETTDAPEGRD